MPGQVYFTGPIPSAGEQFCTFCAMLFKGAALQEPEIAVKVTDGNAKDASEITWVDLNQAMAHWPQAATCMGFAILPIAGTGQQVPALVPLCWSHVNGLILSGSNLVVASAAQLPPEQRPGVPLLGQG